MPPAPTRTLTATLVVLTLAACGDTHYNTADVNASADTVDTEAIVAELTSQTWSYRQITAALCNDSGETWTFYDDGRVEVVWWDDNYPEDVAEGCDTSSSSELGTYQVDSAGLVTIQLDTWTREAVWQVAVDEVPRYADDTTDLLLTQRAWRATTPGGRAFSQRHHGARRTSAAWAETVGALSFTTGGRGEGPCELTLTLEATAQDSDGARSEATTSDTLDCQIEALGVEDWMVISVEGRDDFLGSPSMGSQADWALFDVRYPLVNDGPRLAFRSSSPDVLIPLFDDEFMLW